MQKQSRRDILVLSAAGLAGVGIAAAANTARAEGDDSALLALERDWTALLEQWRADPDPSDETFDAYGERHIALIDKMNATPAHGLDGLMVKWRHVQYWNDIGSGDGLDKACAAFETALLAFAGRVS